MVESNFISGSPPVPVASVPGWAPEDTTLPGGPGSHSVGPSVVWGEAEAWLCYIHWRWAMQLATSPCGSLGSSRNLSELCFTLFKMEMGCLGGSVG